MKNITFDSTSLSDQLGLYDFFNVLIYGATFVGGVCVLNANFCNYLWNNLSFQKGLAIILLIYIAGMILQEIGSTVDKKSKNLYTGMHRSILNGSLDEEYEKESSNKIIKNPVILKRYRDVADRLIEEFDLKDKADRFENEYINGYVFSICQYTVSFKGEDKKVEKLRALFNMSITLMSCFFLLAICAFFTLILNLDMSVKICNIFGLPLHGCEHCLDKIIMVVVFLGAGFAFYFRAKSTMRNFLLILLGTYNAILETDDSENNQGEI